MGCFLATLANLTGVRFMARAGRTLYYCLLFYQGYRRDLYFSMHAPWKRNLRNALGEFGVGLVMMLSWTSYIWIFILAIVGSTLELFSLQFCLGWLMTLSFFAFGYILIPQTPPWIKYFETNHSQSDIDLVQKRGRAMLEAYPTRFSQMIQDQTGWEIWLSTII